MPRKPISLQLYTLREQAKNDFFGVLKVVAETGYVGVEFAGLHGQKPADVRKVLDDLGLKASGAHAPFPTPGNLNQVADEAGALGYEFVVIPYLPRERFATADEIRRMADVIQATAMMLRSNGLKLCYHNHSHEMAMVDGEYALARLLDGAKALLAQVDTYWASNFGAVDVPAFVKRYAKRTPLLHLKDGPLVQGEPMTAVGQGKMNFPPILEAASRTVLKWAIVELDDCATDMVQAVKDSYSYLTSTGLAKGKR